MIEEPRIITECYADQAFISFLIGKQVEKDNGCNGVLATIFTHWSGKRVLGIIDDDKFKPNHYQEFSELLLENEWILFQKRPNEEHFLISLKPALEKWLINTAKQHNIDLESLEIPNTLKALTRITKKQAVGTNPIFIKLLEALNDSSNFEMLRSQIQSIFEE